MRALRYIFRFFLLLLVLALVAIGGVYAYIRSDAGLDRIAREVNSRASTDDMTIELTGLRGDVFHALTLAKLTLSDRDGIWLELHDLRVVWSPRSLLRKQAPLATLEAGKINVLRTPLPSQAAPETSKSESPALRDFAIYLPRTLAIHELYVAEPVAGIEQRVSLKGSGDETRYALNLATLQGVPLTLDALVQPQQENFAAKIAFEEAEGGIVAALLKLPNNIALSLNADITADSKGDIAIHTAHMKAGSLSADAKGSYSTSSKQIDLSLTARAPDMSVPQAFSGVAMSGSADVALTAQGTFDALAVTFDASTPHLVVQENRIASSTVTAKAALNPSAWGSDAFKVDGSVAAKGTHNDSAFSLALTGNASDGRVVLPDLVITYGPNSINGKAEANGTLAAFELVSDIALKTADGTSQLALNGKVDSEKARYTGDAKGTFTHQKNTFNFAATLDADATQADISKLSLKGPGAEVEGSAKLLIAEQLADASLKVRARDLAPLGQVIRQPLSGSLTADITLKHSGGRQAADITAKAQQLSLPGLTVAGEDVKARASDA